MLHSISQQIWKTQQWSQDWKRSVFIPIPKKGNARQCSNCCTIALISHASKVKLKILQARLQQYVNQELPEVQAGFRKGRRKWQTTPVFLPGESQGRGSLMGCHLWGCTESDTTEETWQQQQQRNQRSNCQHPLDDWKSKTATYTPFLSPSFLVCKMGMTVSVSNA